MEVVDDFILYELWETIIDFNENKFIIKVTIVIHKNRKFERNKAFKSRIQRCSLGILRNIILMNF